MFMLVKMDAIPRRKKIIPENLQRQFNKPKFGDEILSCRVEE